MKLRTGALAAVVCSAAAWTVAGCGATNPVATTRTSDASGVQVRASVSTAARGCLAANGLTYSDDRSSPRVAVGTAPGAGRVEIALGPAGYVVSGRADGSYARAVNDRFAGAVRKCVRAARAPGRVGPPDLLRPQWSALQRCLKGHPLFIVNVTNDGKSLNLMSQTHGSIANFDDDATRARALADAKVRNGAATPQSEPGDVDYALTAGSLLYQLTSGTTSLNESDISNCVASAYGMTGS
jgi:hypothetical protein